MASSGCRGTNLFHYLDQLANFVTVWEPLKN